MNQGDPSKKDKLDFLEEAVSAYEELGRRAIEMATKGDESEQEATFDEAVAVMVCGALDELRIIGVLHKDYRNKSGGEPSDGILNSVGLQMWRHFYVTGDLPSLEQVRDCINHKEFVSGVGDGTDRCKAVAAEIAHACIHNGPLSLLGKRYDQNFKEFRAE